MGVCCITVPVPDSPEYIAQFMGAIWRMSLQTHYERDAAHSGKLVAAKWRAIWLELQTMGCCKDTVINNYIQIQIAHNTTKNILQQLYLTYIAASLDVQVAFIGVPDLYDSDPGDSGPEIAQRELALCVATKSWVDQTCNMGMAWLEGALIDAIPVATGLIAIPLIPTPVTVMLGITALYFSSFVHGQLNDAAYRQYLACGMLEALQGEDATDKTTFDAAFDNLPARPPPSETGDENIARDIIEKWLRAVVNDLENYLGFVSTLNAAMSIAATLDESDCSCLEWEMTWLGGFNEAGDWTLVPYGVGFDDTTYNAIEDRFEGTCQPDDVYGARCEITFDESTITRIRAFNSWSSKRSTSGNRSEIGHEGDIDFYAMLTHPDNEDSHVIDTGIISATETNIRIRSAGGSDDCGQGGYARINKIIISGEGLNPFL